MKNRIKTWNSKFEFFIQWHTNLPGLSNVKINLVEEWWWYYSTLSWGGARSFILFQNVFVVARLEFKLTYYNVAVQAVDTTPRWLPPIKCCPVSWGCRIHWLHLCREVRHPPTSILDITLNNLMVRFQQCWSFGECGVPLRCHRSQVHSGPEW